MAAWKEYQDQVGDFFRALGLDAQTDAVLQGARTTHRVDVLVRSHHIGFDVTWIIECKHWDRPVSKLHVLALREIVSDLGADRGILLAERGFQRGAIEAATLTNVHVTSLAGARRSARAEISAMRLRELYDRIDACRAQYWTIPKQIRIDSGLRPDVTDTRISYSAPSVMDTVTELINTALRGAFPISTRDAWSRQQLPAQLATPEELVAAVEPLITDLETKLRGHHGTDA